jgi:hypothetical protein
LNATSNWSLRCGDGEAQFYGTVTATNFIGPAQGLTGTAPNLVAGNVTINYLIILIQLIKCYGVLVLVYMVLLVFIVILLQIHTNGDIVAFAASDRRLT